MSKKSISKKEKARRLVRLICAFAAIGCLGYFAIYVYMAGDSEGKFNDLAKIRDNKDSNRNVLTGNRATVTLDAEVEAPPMLEEFNTLYIKNKKIVGWISIEGTTIDYPVMQSSNEDYYLDHNFEQQKDKNGSIFMDADCSIWPRSQNLIIYGHNMKSGKMFGALDAYKSKSFCEKHPTIKFDTLYEKGEYRIMYVFNEVVHEEAEVAFKYYQFVDANSEQEYRSNMEQMAEMSLYDTGVESYYGDSLITLSTCDYSKGAERFAVVAKKIN